jgi:hypothetical protein
MVVAGIDIDLKVVVEGPVADLELEGFNGRSRSS